MTASILEKAKNLAANGQYKSAVDLLTTLELQNIYDEDALLHKSSYLSALEQPEEMFVTSFIGAKKFNNPTFNGFKGQALGIMGQYEASIKELEIAAKSGDRASINNLSVSKQLLAEVTPMLKMKTLIGEPPIFLDSVFFVSSGHKRFENNNLVNNSPNVFRAVRIQDNINGGANYSVTIYSLENPHPMWKSYIQMGTKQMKVIEKNKTAIKLQGYGSDNLGNSFSDYGIELKCDADQITEVTLFMYDRNVKIVYT